MYRPLLATCAVAAVVAAAASPAATPATPKTMICGQLKGPHATYLFRVNNKKLSGRTWTVFATGVPCAKAMKAAPKILAWWGKAKVEASDLNVGGFLCTKESDGHGSSGSAGCSYKGLSNIELMMTGSYTVAQLKRMFFIQ
jgi:hypothetical protein